MNKRRVAEILKEAVQGTGGARDELFALYLPFLKFVANDLVGPSLAKRNDASDLVQQTCTDAIRQLDGFRGKSEPEFTAWITSILRNQVANAYRFNMQEKRDMRRETSRLPSDSTASIGWHSISGETATPLEVVIKGEAALFLLHAISELPAAQRTVIAKRFLEGRKLIDIASEMDSTVGAVAGLLRRGLQKVRQELPPDIQANK